MKHSRTDAQATRTALQQAFTLQRGGRLAEAEQAFRALLAVHPDQPEGLHGLGITLQGLGRPDEALAHARRATVVAPSHPGLRYNLGVVLQERGAIGAAQAAFAEAARLKPDFFQAWNNLGLALQDLRRFDEATEAFRRALAIRPDYVGALHNLGNLLLSTEREEEALATFRRLRSIEPADVTVRRKEAQALLRLGCGEEAQGVLDGDLAAVARLCAQMNDTENAKAWYRRLVQQAPQNWLARMEACLALPAVYSSADAVLRSRQSFTDGLAQLSALAEQPAGDTPQILRAVQRDNFFLAYQGEDDRMLQADYAKLVQRLLEPLVAKDVLAPVPKVTGRTRLRIGFAGAFFRDCTAGQYFKSWITDLDPRRFEKIVYVLGGAEDRVSTEIWRAATRHVRLEQSLPEVARIIRRDRLDMLVFPELGMNGRTYALAALRLAPVQCAGWGHPVTSGHASIDYAFSSALMEPEEGDRHYVERLVRLPGLGTRYDKPAVGISYVRADFGLPEQARLYFFPHPPFKIHPDNDPLLARILEGDPEGLLVLFEGETRWMTNALLARLTVHGISPERIRLLPTMPRASYLEVNRLCDLMLDTCRWSGGNTTLDAIAAGLPIVTRRGRFMRSRQSAGMLSAMGLDELIANDDEQYITLALRLARDRPYRENVVRRMAVAEGKIFGDLEPVRALERFFESVAGRT